MSELGQKMPPQGDSEGGQQPPSAPRCRPRLLCRVACTLGRGLRYLLCSLLRRRVVVTLLMAAIALELTMLGIGVIHKLREAYRWETELAQAHLAAVEAEQLSKGMADSSLTEGSAGIGADPAAKQAISAGNEAPPLRPRDIETIIEQETGGWNEADDPVLNAAAQQQEQTPATGEDEAPAPDATAPPAEQQAIILSEEDAAELDRLIRQGVAAMTAGDMRRCVLSFEQARCLAPEHPALLYYYGLAYDKLLNPNRAREYYMKLFHMRDRAGIYFERASRRLTYGLEQPSAMRGKLSFGPHQVRHRYDEHEGEQVSILLPVLLAPGEEVRPDDLYVTFQAFDLVNGRKIEFARLAKPQMAWENPSPTWAGWEENLRIEYAVPPLTQEELEAYGDLKYYGFTAKLYYKGEPLDCISSPSALILQEQRLLSRRAHSSTNHLLPDDGLEQAQPAADFLNDLANPLP